MERSPRGQLGRWAMGDTENKHPRFRTRTSLWLSKWMKSGGVYGHGQMEKLELASRIWSFQNHKPLLWPFPLVTNLCVLQSGSSAFPVDLTRVMSQTVWKLPLPSSSSSVARAQPLPSSLCFSHLPPVKTAPNRSSLIQSPLNAGPETCNDFDSNPAHPKGVALSKPHDMLDPLTPHVKTEWLSPRLLWEQLMRIVWQPPPACLALFTNGSASTDSTTMVWKCHKQNWVCSDCMQAFSLVVIPPNSTVEG